MQKFMLFGRVQTCPKQKQFLITIFCRPLTSSMDFVLSVRIRTHLSEKLQLYTDSLIENSKAVGQIWEA